MSYTIYVIQFNLSDPYYFLMEKPVLDFYQGEFHNIINMNDSQWEARHDFIQYLFPNDEPSATLPNAPLITPKLQQIFRTNEDLRQKQRIAFYRFLEHIGLEYIQLNGTIVIQNSGLVHLRIERPNHNRLRITRVLRSMILLGQSHLSNELYKVLLDIHNRVHIDQTTMKYWTSAIDLSSK